MVIFRPSHLRSAIALLPEFFQIQLRWHGAKSQHGSSETQTRSVQACPGRGVVGRIIAMKNVWHACLAFVVTGSILSAQEALPPPVQVEVKQGESIQAALDKLPESGGIVRIAPGNFVISEPLVVRTAETRIEGSGASTHIINKNEEEQPAIHIRPDAYAEDKKARLWRIQADNFRVSGNEKSGHGIFAQGIQEIFLHGVSIDHHGGHGIFLDFCFEDPRIADCILTYNKESGVHLVGNHDIVVDANHFEENNDALTCLDGFNLTFNGNNIDDHLRHGVVIENTYGSVVTGNMIEECAGTAIILDRDCYGITLSSNVIAHDLGGGIDMRDAWGCAISANTFTIIHKFGVRVSKDSGRLTITGNNFSNSYHGEGLMKRKEQHENEWQIDSGEGVLLESTENNVINGNVFSGMDAHAVLATGTSTGNSITDNIVTDYGRREAVENPIAVPADGGNQVKDNLVSKPAKPVPAGPAKP